tara:strand:- start:1401 stop:1787 length:387 start_codon:yes stop_codon:yes gene_type:complete
VFSQVDENGEVKEKYIACNNCGIIHRVYEVFKSEVKWGQEDVKSLIASKDDIKFNLEAQGFEKIISLLEKSDLDISDWEMAEHLLENNTSGHIVLERKESDNNVVLKVLNINEDNSFKLKKEILQRYL